jgi:hypothetical protein
MFTVQRSGVMPSPAGLAPGCLNVAFGWGIVAARPDALGGNWN